MRTLKTKETAASSIVGLVVGLCKKNKLAVKAVRPALDAQDEAVTLIDIVVNDKLMLESESYFLPMPLVAALNKLAFSTKKFMYTTGHNPKNPRILTLLVNEVSNTMAPYKVNTNQANV